MRFPAPDRFNFKYVALFAIVIFVGQELEGTDPLFALLTAAYTLLWAAAFNLSGGIGYPSGAFIFFNGFLNVIVGLTFKMLLFEPGERNLQAPNATMFVYCVGMAAMLAAVSIARSLRSQRGLLPGLGSVAAYKQAAIVCIVIGPLLSVLSIGGSPDANSIFSVLRQVNKLPVMAIMLATTYEIIHSNGKRSFNWIVVVGVLFILASGLVSFSKEGMLLGFTAWFIAAVLQKYDFSRLQLVTTVLALGFFTYYLVPYSQYVRGQRATSLVGDVEVSLHYLSNLGETRRLFEDTIEGYSIADEPHLYDQREGFMDRLVVFAQDDALINYTNQGHVFGLAPTFAAYANIVPHVIWHDKPVYNTGNLYAHELGELAEEDISTGIAFSAAADAYHQAKWLGLMLLLPIDMFLFFLITDSVAGNAKWVPWALLPILELTEIGPEGGLDGPVYSFTYGIVTILFTYWVIRQLAPFILRVLRRPELAPPSSASTEATS
jgi:hypothetical protein